MRRLLAAARQIAGLALIRAGAIVAGVPRGDTRISPPEDDDSDTDFRGAPVSPVVVTPEALDLVARREPRPRERRPFEVQVPVRRVGR